MKVSRKYMKILDVYLDWEKVSTPASGSFQESRKSAPLIEVDPCGSTAAEALCIWESQGKPSTVRPDELGLLSRYVKGKGQRDWWTKEVGWLDKNAAYLPEEFMRHLTPLAFIDIFGRGPIPRLVRYYFDNNYRIWEFKLDTLMTSKVIEWKMIYFERDDRESSVRNAVRIVRLKWIDPAIYRAKRKFRLHFPLFAR